MAEVLDVAQACSGAVLHKQVKEVNLVKVCLAGHAQPQEGAAVDTHLEWARGYRQGLRRQKAVRLAGDTQPQEGAAVDAHLGRNLNGRGPG